MRIAAALFGFAAICLAQDFTTEVAPLLGKRCSGCHGAAAQMSGPGGMISFDIAGGMPQAVAFLRALEIFACAESLGGVESLAEHPASMTHASLPAEARRAVGIGDGLIRLSVGLEDVRDLVADMERAFDAAARI